jgi:hypothetical protein
MMVKNNNIMYAGPKKVTALFMFQFHIRHPCLHLLQYTLSREEIQAPEPKRKNFYKGKDGGEKNKQNSLKCLDFFKKLIYIKKLPYNG